MWSIKSYLFLHHVNGIETRVESFFVFDEYTGRVFYCLVFPPIHFFFHKESNLWQQQIQVLVFFSTTHTYIDFSVAIYIIIQANVPNFSKHQNTQLVTLSSRVAFPQHDLIILIGTWTWMILMKRRIYWCLKLQACCLRLLWLANVNST